MAAKKKTSPATELVQDVAPPDTTEPDSSAKPILITHRPIVKDPMVTEAETTGSQEAGESKPEVKAPSEMRKVIAPSPDSTQTEAATVPVAAKKPETEETLSVDGLPDSKLTEEDSKQRAKHQAAIDKMVEDRTYYLPINQVEKRRNKRNTILGLIFVVVLAAAWLDISLDSGILTIPGVEAPTHLFR